MDSDQKPADLNPGLPPYIYIHFEIGGKIILFLYFCTNVHITHKQNKENSHQFLGYMVYLAGENPLCLG